MFTVVLVPWMVFVALPVLQRPYGLKLAGFQRHSVFLADEAVVFVFEGFEIEGLVRDLVNEGPAQPNSRSGPRFFRELPCSRGRFYWEAGQSEDATGIVAVANRCRPAFKLELRSFLVSRGRESDAYGA